AGGAVASLVSFGPAKNRGATPRATRIRTALTLAIAAVVLVASTLLTVQQVFGRAAVPPIGRRLLAAIEPLRSVSSYGLFARMTTVRDEIVIEGSDDA